MSGIDYERIEKAKEGRRQQLIFWERYNSETLELEKEKLSENEHGEPYSNAKNRSRRSIMFESSVIFLESAARDDIKEIKQLLKMGVDPNVKNEDGLTALHQCCIDNSIEMCNLLLTNGANVNATDNELWTPLHAAATCGHRELCEILIKNGADLLAVNVDGNMPYDLCDHEDTLILVENMMASQSITQKQIDEIRLRPEQEMLEDLQRRLRSKENLNVLDSQGAAPLHIACACGFIDVARFLLESKVDPEFADGEGWLPVHIAVCWAQMEVVEMLVAFGADLNLPTKTGLTVYDISDSKGVHDRLLEIWSRREELQRASNQQQLGFQNARGSGRRKSSSVMRSSRRDKRNMTRKDAEREKEIGKQVEAKLANEGARLDEAELQNGPEHDVAPMQLEFPAQEIPPPVAVSLGSPVETDRISNCDDYPVANKPEPFSVTDRAQPAASPQVAAFNNRKQNCATEISLVNGRQIRTPPIPPPRSRKGKTTNAGSQNTNSPQSSTSTPSPCGSSLTGVHSVSSDNTNAKLTLKELSKSSSQNDVLTLLDNQSQPKRPKARPTPPRDYDKPRPLEIVDQRTNSRNNSDFRVNKPQFSSGDNSPNETLRTDEIPSLNPKAAIRKSPNSHRYQAQLGGPTDCEQINGGGDLGSTPTFTASEMAKPRPSGCCKIM